MNTLIDTTRAELRASYYSIGDKLNQYASQYRLPNGLMPEEYKTEEYKTLKSECEMAFSRLRNFNSIYKPCKIK